MIILLLCEPRYVKSHDGLLKTVTSKDSWKMRALCNRQTAAVSRAPPCPLNNCSHSSYTPSTLQAHTSHSAYPKCQLSTQTLHKHPRSSPIRIVCFSSIRNYHNQHTLIQPSSSDTIPTRYQSYEEDANHKMPM